jgi:hypothetical protein
MQKVLITRTDDLDAAKGKETAAGCEDVVLQLGSRKVLLDLTSAHLAALEKKLAPYFAAGRKPESRGRLRAVGGTGGKKRKAS